MATLQVRTLKDWDWVLKYRMLRSNGSKPSVVCTACDRPGESSSEKNCCW